MEKEDRKEVYGRHKLHVLYFNNEWLERKVLLSLRIVRV